MLNDYEEVKEEKSNSYEWSDENSINNEKDWEDDALLELLLNLYYLSTIYYVFKSKIM